MDMAARLGGLRAGRLFIGALLVLALLGCERGTDARDPSPSTLADGVSESEGEPDPAVTLSAPPRAAFVYVAVLKQALVDARPDGRRGFGVIFVVDGAVHGVARATGTEDPRHPFASDVKEAMQLLGEQGGLPPIEFVPEVETALRGPSAGRNRFQPRDNGLLVLLDRAKVRPIGAEVGSMLWADARAMRWQTYVVKEREGSWRVVGTTGQLAIS
jgi:hypothetical protein